MKSVRVRHEQVRTLWMKGPLEPKEVPERWTSSQTLTPLQKLHLYFINANTDRQIKLLLNLHLYNLHTIFRM